MVIKNASLLSVEYFEAYLKLLMSSRDFEIEQAKEYMKKNFFESNMLKYGEYTYNNFIKACDLYS